MEIFQPLDITSASLVNSYLAEFPPGISELTFTNLFAWRQTRPVWLHESDNTLTFLVRTGICRHDEVVILGRPVGQRPLPEVMERLGERARGAIRVTAGDLAGPGLEELEVQPDRDNFDYVYRIRDLAELRGRKYAKKRSHVKRCLNDHDCTFELLSDRNLEECRELMAGWCRERQCDLDPGLCGESRAINTALDLFGEFNLLGGAVRVDGRIGAFAMAERLNATTAVWHFEKARPGINGLSQLVNQWFARECLQEFEFVNREQDLGIPGLRQAKESYFPDHLVEKYNLFRKIQP